MAIGIVGRPELLFLDEPTAGFDPAARRDFHDLVHRLSDLQDTTILLTTHDLDEAEKLADRILILHHGRIVANGSADELARQVAGTAEVRWTQGGQRHVHATDDATGFVRDLFAHERPDSGPVTELEVQPAQPGEHVPDHGRRRTTDPGGHPMRSTNGTRSPAACAAAGSSSSTACGPGRTSPTT